MKTILLLEIGWGEMRLALCAAEAGACHMLGFEATSLPFGAADAPSAALASGLGSLYCARAVRLDAAAGGAFVDLGDGLSGFLRLKRMNAPGAPSEGETFAVQIAATPRWGKSARVTRSPILEGWFTTFPDRRRSGEKRRKRRAAATTPERIEAERRELAARYERLAACDRPGRLDEQSPVIAALKRWVTPDVTCIRVDDAATAAALRRHFARRWPEFAQRTTIACEPPGLFARFGVDDDIEDALERRVDLDGGGCLIIDETAALVAVDVNAGDAGTGIAPGRHGDRTLRDVDRRAAAAVAREIGRRNLSGLIVIDFLSPRRKFLSSRGGGGENEAAAILRARLKEDDAVSRIEASSSLGVVAVVRERSGPSLSETMLNEAGARRGKSTAACALACLRALRAHQGAGRAAMRVSTAVKAWLSDVGALKLAPPHIAVAAVPGLADEDWSLDATS